MKPATFWYDRMSLVQPYWWDEACAVFSEAEPLRERAKFNTGSISLVAAVALRALSVWVKPNVIIEVGTFIGVSTRSLKAEHIYTCDISNDCLEKSEKVTCFPYTKSTDMLRKLDKAHVTAELCFFDGLLEDEDIPLILRLTTPDAVYVFDDYNESFKGVQNVAKLQPALPEGYWLAPPSGPIKRSTTLAALVPESRL